MTLIHLSLSFSPLLIEPVSVTETCCLQSAYDSQLVSLHSAHGSVNYEPSITKTSVPSNSHSESNHSAYDSVQLRAISHQNLGAFQTLI